MKMLLTKAVLGSLLGWHGSDRRLSRKDEQHPPHHDCGGFHKRSSSRKRVVAAVLLALALAVSRPAYGDDIGRSQADLPQSYAMFTIANTSPNVTITYYVRWGTSQWKSITLQPGQRERHWSSLDAAGNAPTPYVLFDNVVNGRGRKAYRLVPSAVSFGQAGTAGTPTPYRFQPSADGRFVDLYSE